MKQLESVNLFTSELLEIARTRLNKRTESPESQILNQLKGMTAQRLQCPFCLYVDARGRGFSSRIFPDGSFKCFACGKFGRIPQ